MKAKVRKFKLGSQRLGRWREVEIDASGSNRKIIFQGEVFKHNAPMG